MLKTYALAGVSGLLFWIIFMLFYRVWVQLFLVFVGDFNTCGKKCDEREMYSKATRHLLESTQ